MGYVATSTPTRPQPIISDDCGHGVSNHGRLLLESYKLYYRLNIRAERVLECTPTDYEA